MPVAQAPAPQGRNNLAQGVSPGLAFQDDVARHDICDVVPREKSSFGAVGGWPTLLLSLSCRSVDKQRP